MIEFVCAALWGGRLEDAECLRSQPHLSIAAVP